MKAATRRLPSGLCVCNRLKSFNISAMQCIHHCIRARCAAGLINGNLVVQCYTPWTDFNQIRSINASHHGMGVLPSYRSRF